MAQLFTRRKNDTNDMQVGEFLRLPGALSIEQLAHTGDNDASNVMQTLERQFGVVATRNGRLVIPEASFFIRLRHTPRFFKGFGDAEFCRQISLFGRLHVPVQGLFVGLFLATTQLVAQTEFSHAIGVSGFGSRFKPTGRRVDINFNASVLGIITFINHTQPVGRGNVVAEFKGGRQPGQALGARFIHPISLEVAVGNLAHGGSKERCLFVIIVGLARNALFVDTDIGEFHQVLHGEGRIGL
mmetsp:Transcript_11390/g.21750  ORF Transcript_11390/g.21750 Transcript_11390/m.21750 type:complete len:242 (+) Transcript_11390:25-750(+)